MEKPTNAEWHKQHQARLARLAAEMGKRYVLGHETPQSAEYQALNAEYLWELHVKAEHDKFGDKPHYGDHRNG